MRIPYVDPVVVSAALVLIVILLHQFRPRSLWLHQALGFLIVPVVIAAFIANTLVAAIGLGLYMTIKISFAPPIPMRWHHD